MLREERYDLYGTIIQITYAHPETESAVKDIIQHLGFETVCASGRAPHFKFEYSIADPEWLLPEAGSEAAIFDSGAKAWYAGGHLFVGGVGAIMRLDQSTGSTLVKISPRYLNRTGAVRAGTFTLTLIGIITLLRHRRLFSMHAAALARNNKGVLLVANSDSGKSTLSYSLVRKGWQFLSDDAILLRAEQDRVEALAFRKNFGLDFEAGALFPELAGGWHAQFNDESKWSIPVHDLYPAQETSRCVPKVLVFPEIVNQPESVVVEVDKVEALRRLLAQSSNVTLEPELAPVHLDVLKHLVNQTRHYRLLAGRDLKTNPALVASMFEELLSVAPS